MRVFFSQCCNIFGFEITHASFYVLKVQAICCFLQSPAASVSLRNLSSSFLYLISVDLQTLWQYRNAWENAVIVFHKPGKQRQRKVTKNTFKISESWLLTFYLFKIEGRRNLLCALLKSL